MDREAVEDLVRRAVRRAAGAVAFPLRVPRQPAGEPPPACGPEVAGQLRTFAGVSGYVDGLYSCPPGGSAWAQQLGLGDPGADRLPFWDDSANGLAWLTAGSGLGIAGTVLAAALAPPGLVPVVHFGAAVTASNASTVTYQTFLTKSVVLPAGTYDIDIIFVAEFLNNTGGDGATARISAPTAGGAFDAAETTANSQFTIPGGHSLTGHVSDGSTPTAFTLQYRANVGGTASTRSACFLALCRRTA